MTHLPVQALTLAVGTLIPLLTGFVTKEKAPAWVKAVVNGLLSAITGAAILAIHSGGSVDLSQWVIGIAEAWGASIVSYHGFWSPTSIGGKVQHLLPEFGIGTAQIEEGEEKLDSWNPTLGHFITGLITDSPLVSVSDTAASTSSSAVHSVSLSASNTSVVYDQDEMEKPVEKSVVEERLPEPILGTDVPVEAMSAVQPEAKPEPEVEVKPEPVGKPDSELVLPVHVIRPDAEVKQEELKLEVQPVKEEAKPEPEKPAVDATKDALMQASQALAQAQAAISNALANG